VLPGPRAVVWATLAAVVAAIAIAMGAIVTRRRPG
jgi:hypothetical protein